MRSMLGIKHGPLTDAVVTPPIKAIHTLMHKSVPLTFQLMKLIAPAALPVAAPVLLGIPAVNPVTMTPREAQRKYGYDVPREAHQDLRAKQHDRVFARGEKPSDEGLVESQQHIGAMEALPGGMPALA
jgi:hypothetical protein